MDNLHNQIQWILQEKYKGRLTALAKKDIARLKAKEPVDYIIGWVDFLGCKIDLSQKPLIPRVETEFWVERAITDISNNFHSREIFGIKVLDMFSGSGCIGIVAAKHIKNAHVTFADAEKHCLRQIRHNIRINSISNTRCRVAQSDIFSNIKGKFDYILANPPYISAKRKHRVQESVLRYEPSLALFGGNDGLSYIRKFLSGARNFLNPGGAVYMEFDPLQKEQIASMLKKFGYCHYTFNKDQYGRWRHIVAE